MSRYVIRGGREGYDRLKVLARAHWEPTFALLRSVPVRPGMSCLDLGCGGGDVSLELAGIVGAQGGVVGIDMDGVKLDLARADALDRGLSNVEFRVQDVMVWNEPGAYDLVYSRFLLEHLSQPLDVLRRMWSAVKKGGALAVEVTDFSGLFCEPANVGYEFFARVFPLTTSRYGGDASRGRKLFGLFLEAHIPELRLNLVQRANSSGEAKRLPLLTLEASVESIVDGGLATTAEVEAAIADLRAFTDDPTTVIGSPRFFQVWATRA